MPLELALTEAEEWKFKNDSVESELFTTDIVLVGQLEQVPWTSTKKKKSWHHKFAGPKADFNKHGRRCREKFTNDWLMYQTDSVCNDFHIKEITCQTCQNVRSLSQGIQGKLAPCWH